MSKSLEQAQSALAAANAAYLGELERDSERGEGSGAQERRREDRQQSLRDDIDRCERELDVAVRAQASQAECVMCGGTGGWPGVTGLVHCKPCNGTGKAKAKA